MSDLRDFTGKNRRFTGTGSITVPQGTTAQEPANAAGQLRYDSDQGLLTYNDGSDWYKVSAVLASLSSVTGNIIENTASDLTLAGEGFLTANLIVNFTQTSDGINTDVTVTPTSDTAATVSVPAAVYNNVTVGNAVTIKVTNSDGSASTGVNTTAVGLPTGGTINTYTGYRSHKFTSSGTWGNTFITSVDYLIVAGGGGGGTDNSGGGGAGGMLTGTGRSVSTDTNYSITVGSGGAGASNTGGDSGPYAANGGNSSFDGLTATGGGRGSSSGGANANSGGSGGGGGQESASSSGGSGTSGQGNSGGSGGGNGGGGGGGKGGSGGNGGGNLGGSGGAGAQNDYETGSNQFYAAGGHGGNENGIYTQPGRPSGIGGQTGNPTTAGVDGTGSGGGGGVNSNSIGSRGGNGVVVIRYQI